MRHSKDGFSIPSDGELLAIRKQFINVGYVLYRERKGWCAMSVEGLERFIDKDIDRLLSHVTLYEEQKGSY